MIHVQCGQSKLSGSKWTVKSVASKVVRLKIEVAQKKTVIRDFDIPFFGTIFANRLIQVSSDVQKYDRPLTVLWILANRPSTLALAHYFARIYMIELTVTCPKNFKNLILLQNKMSVK